MANPWESSPPGIAKQFWVGGTRRALVFFGGAGFGERGGGVVAWVYFKEGMDELPEKREKPVRLEYYAINAPAERARAKGMFRWVMLGVGWVPFACGVASSRVVVRSGMAEVIRVHINAGAMFMAIGALLSMM